MSRYHIPLLNGSSVQFVRRECLDKTLFWNECDLERKLPNFKNHYNRHRTHDASPAMRAELTESKIIDLDNHH